MRYAEDLEAHVQSGDRQSFFFFRIPDAWAELADFDLQTQIWNVAEKMYVDLNERFRNAEPSDMSYMLVKHTQAVLDASAAGAKPWMEAENPAAWEPTPCVVANDDGSYEKVAREGF